VRLQPTRQPPPSTSLTVAPASANPATTTSQDGRIGWRLGQDGSRLEPARVDAQVALVQPADEVEVIRLGARVSSDSKVRPVRTPDPTFHPLA